MILATVIVAATAAVCIGAFFSLLFYCRHAKKVLFLSRFPGPPRLPILGSALEVNVTNQEMTNLCLFEWPKLYGPRFCMSFGSSFYFVSLNPTDVEKLLKSTVHIDKFEHWSFFEPWLGEGLITVSGSKWAQRRKFLTPAFHFKFLENFLSAFNSQSQILVQILREESKGGDKEVEICHYVALCTLDILCQTAMGEVLGLQRKEDSSYVEAMSKISGLQQYRFARPWLYPNFIWNLTSAGRLYQDCIKNLHSFTEKVVEKRKAGVQQRTSVANENSAEVTSTVHPKKHAAFLDLLLQHQMENPAKLSNAYIRDETNTFMAGGYDTVAACISWTTHLLGAHPHYQAPKEAVYEELLSIFGKDKDSPVTSLHLGRMKYLECCIKESLRLYPAAPNIVRHLKQDLVLDNETVIPKGLHFLIMIYQLHRNPEIFPDPEEFKPDRFFPENCIGRHPFAYLPFSAGPRNCIGQKFAMMEIKVVMANLIRNFRIESLDRREDIKLSTEVILRPRNGLQVRLVPR